MSLGDAMYGKYFRAKPNYIKHYTIAQMKTFNTLRNCVIPKLKKMGIQFAIIPWKPDPDMGHYMRDYVDYAVSKKIDENCPFMYIGLHLYGNNIPLKPELAIHYSLTKEEQKKAEYLFRNTFKSKYSWSGKVKDVMKLKL